MFRDKVDEFITELFKGKSGTTIFIGNAKPWLDNKYTEINLNYLKKSRKFCERACKKKKIAEACKATQDLSLIK